MKCPKCGYNSFDYLDSCKKCKKDLTEHKARFNIQSILLSEMPDEAVSKTAEEIVAPIAASANVSIDDFAGGSAETDADDFGFDFMGDSEDDENLAFDELFEEVTSEDDIEETLPAPAAEAEPAVPLDQEFAEEDASEKQEETTLDAFSFDESEPDLTSPETVMVTPTSPDEFGFDTEDDPAADIFAESEEDFSLDAMDFEDSEKK